MGSSSSLTPFMLSPREVCWVECRRAGTYQAPRSSIDMSAPGTSRHFAAAQQFGRIWSDADINHRAGFMMGWTPPDGIGVPKVEVLSTT